MPKDSDVQACWSADHDVQLRTLKLGFRQRQRFLDERVKHGLLDEPSEAKTWLGRWQLGQLVGVHVERWGLRMRKSSRVLCQFYTLSGAHGKLQDTFLHSDSHHRRSPCPIWALHAFCIPGATWHASWWTPEAPTSRALNDRSGNCCKQREGWTGRYYCCGLGTAQLLLGETTFLLGDVCGRRAVEL